ncbi:hypothetical protein BKA65DRAFT_161997 [Rhexocercosporidium sp. MPI-PUGE-AT-0058]|nr:hypothetical protein BKA65DRAFT_161997 [Rhexocercosporidium sp. MPI-PUGE-AT-0058]
MGQISKLPSSKSNPDTKKIKCDYEEYDCQKYFSRAREMIRHKHEFHEDPKKCPWCTYSAKRDGRLWEHLRDEHEPRPYTTQPKTLPVPEPTQREAQSPDTRQPIGLMDTKKSSLPSDSGHWSRGKERGQNPREVSPILGQVEEGSNRPELNYTMEQVRDFSQANQHTIGLPALPAATLDKSPPIMSWANPLDTPPQQFVNPNTFEYTSSSHVFPGTDVNGYSPRPIMVSPQAHRLPIQQYDTSFQPGHQPASFLTPFQGQSLGQPSFDEQHWAAPVNQTSEYGSYTYNTDYQGVDAAPPSFAQTSPAAPRMLQSRVPRAIPSNVLRMDGSWRAQTAPPTASPADLAEDQNAEIDQDSAYSNDCGGWGIDD